jgi:folate-binding protein YgfZ
MFITHPTTLMNPDLLQKIKSPTLAWLPGPRALLRLTGPDRLRFLNGQVTQDVKKLLPGHAVHSAIITSKGRLEADLHIAATSDSLLIETDFILRESLCSRLEKFIVADDITLEDISTSFTLAHFPSLSSPPNDAPKDSLFFQSDRFREPGLDLWIPSTSPYQPPSSPLPEWEPLRIARGLPLWGIDVGPDTLPPEAGFESDAISSTKGCYIGQEVISRLRSVGHVNRHLCVLASSPTAIPPLPLECTTPEGTTLGKMTSTTSLPDSSAILSLAMIKRDYATTGNSVLAGGATWTILRHA